MKAQPETLIKLDGQRKYGLYRVRSGKAPVLVKELSVEEVGQFTHHTHYVNDFFVVKERLIKVEMNLSDLTRAAARFFEFEANQQEFIDQLESSKLDLVNANRLCSNFVYSWFNCVELMEVQVKRAYENNKEKLDEWTGIKRHFFNSRFEYRFLYTVRNYQHAENLVTAIKYEKGMPIPVFSKAYLLEFDAFNKPSFRDDWQQFGVHFPVLPILSNALIPLREMLEKHLELNRDFYLAHAEYILAHFGRYSGRNMGIGYLLTPGFLANNEFQHVQIDMAKSISNYYSANSL